MLCADHGPCVSGAHNAIVTSRAGKDLVSCLVSGLLTIGPRFGGAIDDAARCFKDAVERGLAPADFVEGLKRQGKRVPGIGHRIKSKDNRDKRVELLQNYARKVRRVCARRVGGGRFCVFARRLDARVRPTRPINTHV